jgi:hypothetical protein
MRDCSSRVSGAPFNDGYQRIPVDEIRQQVVKRFKAELLPALATRFLAGKTRSQFRDGNNTRRRRRRRDDFGIHVS